LALATLSESFKPCCLTNVKQCLTNDAREHCEHQVERP